MDAEEKIQEAVEVPEDTSLVPAETQLLPLSCISLSLSFSPVSTLIKPSCPPRLSSSFNLSYPHQFSYPSSLSLTSRPPPNFALQSATTFVPLQSSILNPFSGSSLPHNGLGLRRAALVWFRCDLRLHDNEALTAANEDSLSVLPVYCFDPRDYGRSSSGFDKTGPYRATFLLQSVSDLRRNLQSRGSNLVVKIGKPETVIPELAKAIGADAVYAHKEVSHSEVTAEEKIEQVMSEEGMEVKYFWGSTLYHIDDLPFRLEEMPSTYGSFREKVRDLQVRKTVHTMDQLRGLPSKGNVEVGDIPTLAELGVSQTTSTTVQDGGKSPAISDMVGGETEAMERLRKFIAECGTHPMKGGNAQDSIYGANFSCKISPWLAIGCLSPRFMFKELKESAERAFCASQKNENATADVGVKWLTFELLWRDFFRFITKKYSSSKKKADATPITTCAGALA